MIVEQKNFLSFAQIRSLFTENDLEQAMTVAHIHTGFSNNLHVINNQYVLKVCGAVKNEQNFEKEAYFYQFFKGEIPVPNIVVFDNSKSLIGRCYMIYELIVGETLYSQWSTYNAAEKEQIVQALAHILKVINESNYEDYLDKFNDEAHLNWRDERLNQLQSALRIVRQSRLLNAELINRIETYIDKNSSVLNQQKPGITYWDLHFDNVLVSESKVVGIIDFEGVGMMSIDYALDTIRRLSQYPEIYAPEGIDETVRRHKQDYHSIFTLFKKYYPELFDFENIEQRLNFYSLEYDLKLLPQFPHSQTLRDRLQTYLPNGE